MAKSTPGHVLFREHYAGVYCDAVIARTPEPSCCGLFRLGRRAESRGAYRCFLMRVRTFPSAWRRAAARLRPRTRRARSRPSRISLRQAREVVLQSSPQIAVAERSGGVVHGIDHDSPPVSRLPPRFAYRLIGEKLGERVSPQRHDNLRANHLYLLVEIRRRRRIFRRGTDRGCSAGGTSPCWL